MIENRPQKSWDISHAKPDNDHNPHKKSLILQTFSSPTLQTYRERINDPKPPQRDTFSDPKTDHNHRSTFKKALQFFLVHDDELGEAPHRRKRANPVAGLKPGDGAANGLDDAGEVGSGDEALH